MTSRCGQRHRDDPGCAVDDGFLVEAGVERDGHEAAAIYPSAGARWAQDPVVDLIGRFPRAKLDEHFGALTPERQAVILPERPATPSDDLQCLDCQTWRLRRRGRGLITTASIEQSHRAGEAQRRWYEKGPRAQLTGCRTGFRAKRGHLLGKL